MDCSTSSSPVFHYLSKFVQTHVHWVNDALQPSYILSPLSHPVLNLSQHQGLFQWVGSSHQVTKVFGASTSASILPMNIQGWFSLGWTGWISLLSKGLSSIFSSTTVQKHQFFNAQPFFIFQLLHLRVQLWRSAGFSYRTSAGLGKQRLLEGTSKTLCTPGPRRK